MLGVKRKTFVKIRGREKRFFMNKFFNILAALLLAVFFASRASAAYQSLATLEFNIVGAGVEVSPGYQAVPKGLSFAINRGHSNG